MPASDAVRVLPIRQVVQRAHPTAWIDHGSHRADFYPYITVPDTYVDDPVDVEFHDTLWFDSGRHLLVDAAGEPIQDNTAVPIGQLEERVSWVRERVEAGDYIELGDADSEPVAVLSTARNANYYHFLFDDLARVGFYEHTPDRARLGFVVTTLRPWQRELLTSVGLAERLVELKPGLFRLHNVWVAPRGLSVICNMRTVGVEYLTRALSTGGEDAPAAKLYISRAGTSHRRVRGEAELLKRLVPLGFKLAKPESMSVDGQMRAFGGSRAVVGAFGAGLANALFMPKGQVLIELAPRQDRLGIHNAIFATIAGLGELRYGLVTGTEVDTTSRDLAIDPAWVTELVACMAA